MSRIVRFAVFGLIIAGVPAAPRLWPARLGSRLMNAPSDFIVAAPSPPVGDASFFVGPPVPGNMFDARRGDAYVEVDMRAAGGDPAVVGPALATKVLDRMKCSACIFAARASTDSGDHERHCV